MECHWTAFHHQGLVNSSSLHTYCLLFVPFSYTLLLSLMFWLHKLFCFVLLLSWGLNPDPRACWASALLLNYITSPGFIDFEEAPILPFCFSLHSSSSVCLYQLTKYLSLARLLVLCLFLIYWGPFAHTHTYRHIQKTHGILLTGL